MDISNQNKDRDKKRRRPVDVSTMVYGKVPPQAKALEEAVLGAIMLERSAIDIVTEILKPECFYVDAHQRIFRAMLRLQQKNQPVDELTICEELRSHDELEMVGGPYYLTKLTKDVVSAANIDSHSRIILQKFLQREVIRISGEAISEAYENSTDVFDLLDQVETKIMGISLNHLRKDFTKADSVLVEVVRRVEHLRTLDHSLTGVPSGYADLDQCTCGWQPTDLIILAARPGVGKTAFALNLARNATTHPYRPTPVGIFSLEMSRHQLVERLLAAESELWLQSIRRGKLSEDKIVKFYKDGVHKVANMELYIDDNAGLTMLELRAKARRMVQKYKVGLIIIDYLQLMSGDTNKSDNREREIAMISRGLKRMAKDLQVPVIALSQLSREVEKRAKGNKVPQLSDLRESGALEQDADTVMFLYRPPDDEVKDDADLADKGTVKIAKHRHGELREIDFWVNNKIQKWTEINGLPEGKWKALQIPLDSPLSKDFSQPSKPREDEDLPF